MEKVLIFETFYRPEQYKEYNLSNLPKFVHCINTESDKYPYSELNPFWSEYIFMKYVYEHLDEYDCEYIGFDQYRKRFSYNKVTDILSENKDVIITLDLRHLNMYQDYCLNHKKKDIDNVIKILKTIPSAENMLSLLLKGKIPVIFFSCFIMRKEHFKEMMNIIISVLNSLDKQYKLNYKVENYVNYFKNENKIRDEYGWGSSDKSYEYQRRTFGYLSERLVSLFIICQAEQGIKFYPEIIVDYYEI